MGCTSLSSIPGTELCTNWFIIGLKWIYITLVYLNSDTPEAFYFAFIFLYLYHLLLQKDFPKHSGLKLGRPTKLQHWSFCKRIWTGLTNDRSGLLTGGLSSGSHKQISRQAGPPLTKTPGLTVTGMSSSSKRWAHPYPRWFTCCIQRGTTCMLWFPHSDSSGKSHWRTDCRLGFHILYTFLFFEGRRGRF